ncbi:hypothetical protein LMG28138_03032 [Pararobbsia alpina]|uniref:Uncharacterized protein n=1 Tax=Pararobbsia alpina TaxID=621374 RepID=A0A6S7B8F3_9BURK|nr:hypothetical protein LMG28138_03032 [Pararobbsia alpina]
MMFGYFARLHVGCFAPGLFHVNARSVAAVPSMLMSVSGSIKRSVWLLVSGVLVCTCLAACGGHDDDNHAVSSSANSDASRSDSASESSSASQLDSSTVANVTPPASGALAPPVMHFAQ